MGFKRSLVTLQKGTYWKSIRRLLEAKRACVDFERLKKKFTFLYKQSEELLVKIKRYTNRLTSVLTSMGISTE